MEEHDVTTEEMPTKSLGGVLLLARTEVGLSQEDVAKKLYLSKTFINHIENDEFDQLHQNAVFIRGYLRSYARLVNIPDDEIIALLNQSGIKDKELPKKTYVKPRKQYSTRDKKVKWITWGIIILFLVLIFVWWRSQVTTTQTQVAPSGIQKQTQTPVATQAVTTTTPNTKDTTVKPDAKQITSQLTMDNGTS